MPSIKSSYYQTSPTHKIMDYVPIVSWLSAVYHLFIIIINLKSNQLKKNLSDYDVKILAKDWNHGKRAALASALFIGNIILFIHDRKTKCKADFKTFQEQEVIEIESAIEENNKPAQKQIPKIEELVEIDLLDFQKKESLIKERLSLLENNWNTALQYNISLRVQLEEEVLDDFVHFSYEDLSKNLQQIYQKIQSTIQKLISKKIEQNEETITKLENKIDQFNNRLKDAFSKIKEIEKEFDQYDTDLRELLEENQSLEDLIIQKKIEALAEEERRKKQEAIYRKYVKACIKIGVKPLSLEEERRYFQLKREIDFLEQENSFYQEIINQENVSSEKVVEKQTAVLTKIQFLKEEFEPLRIKKEVNLI